MKKFFHAAFLASALLLGAGCVRETSSSLAPTSDDMTTTLSSNPEGSVASSTPDVVEPTVWERTETPTNVKFTAPKGYWVFGIEALRTFYLVPGVASKPGDPDPRVSLAPKAVATFTDVQIDPASFPTWENFEIGMAQFACVSGTTDADFVSCTDKPVNVKTGKTAGGWPYRQFSLPAKLKKTGASQGVRTFIMVRRGEKADIGVLVTVTHERTGVKPALELVQSMK